LVKAIGRMERVLRGAFWNYMYVWKPWRRSTLKLLISVEALQSADGFASALSRPWIQGNDIGVRSAPTRFEADRSCPYLDAANRHLHGIHTHALDFNVRTEVICHDYDQARYASIVSTCRFASKLNQSLAALLCPHGILLRLSVKNLERHFEP
jgi:hypothetical protein